MKELYFASLIAELTHTRRITQPKVLKVKK